MIANDQTKKEKIIREEKEEATTGGGENELDMNLICDPLSDTTKARIRHSCLKKCSLPRPQRETWPLQRPLIIANLIQALQQLRRPPPSRQLHKKC